MLCLSLLFLLALFSVIPSGTGRDTHTRFSESKPQRNSWTEEPRLSARAGRSGVATPPTVERSEPRQRTVRETVTRRVVVGWRSRRRWNRVPRWGDCHRREGLRVDRKGRNAQCVQWACQTRLQQRWNTGNTRLREEQGCPAWKWTNRMSDRPIEEPNQRRNLGRKGEWETIPSGGHSGVRSQEDHKCGPSREERWEGDVACCQEHYES